MSKSKRVQARKNGPGFVPLQKGSLASETSLHGVRSKLLILFFASFLVHLILNFLIKEGPTVVIDEGLYTNIARSLAWEGKLAFRGQPVDYPYLLYPLLLVPVYWLSALLNVDVYRMIQVLNTLLAASSVFPVFLFARDFTRSDRKAFVSALIVSLMPDLLMSSYTMTECLIWPLSLWMIFFAYRFYTDHRLKNGLFTALFSGLLYFTKPGAIAGGAVLLGMELIRSLVKDRRQLRAALLSCLLLLAEIAAVYGIYRLLAPANYSSVIGLYDKQTSEWGSNDTLIAIEGFFLQTYLFCFACGGIFILLPLTHLKQFDPDKRFFILALAAGVLTAIVGTAFFVVPYKWDSLGQIPLHLRYCAVYILPFFIFSQGIEIPYKKLSKAFVPLLAVFLALALFPGVRLGFVKDKSGAIDSMNLAAFVQNKQLDGSVTGWILTVGMFLFLLFFIIALKEEDGWKEKLRKLSTVFFAVFVLFNAVCAHIAASVYIDPTVSSDALEVNDLLRSSGGESLGITQRHYDDIYSYWLESRLTKPMQQVTTDQMFIKMEETGGVYTPFVPVEQSPNVSNHETPDTDLLVLGMTVAEHLEWSSAAQAETTKNGHFTLLQIPDSEPWVDTMMYGLDDNRLYSGSVGYIHIFNENRNIDGTLYLNITASGEGRLLIGGTAVDLSAQMLSYEISVPYSGLISFQAENGDVEILSYTTRKASEIQIE